MWMNDLVSGIILIFLFLFSRINRQDNYRNSLSIYNTTLIKGLGSILVVFCHLSHFYNGVFLLPSLYYFGYASVGLFFFFSGFGLMKQYLTKKDYQIGFLKKRLGKILIPYAVFNVIYWIYYSLTGTVKSIGDICLGFVNGDPLVRYSWYIIEIIVFYVFFYLFMFIDKRRKKVMITCNVVLYFCLMFIFFRFNYSSFWYDSTHLYLLGIVWASYEDSVLDFFYKYRHIILVFSIGVFAATFGKEKLFFVFEIAYLLLLICFFVVFEMKNRLLYEIGKISMEIYLIHGLIIQLCRTYICFDEGPIDIACIVLLTILSSYMMRVFLNFVFKNHGRQ